MTIPPPPTGDSINWITDIFSWEKLSYLTTVLSLTSLGAIVPLYGVLKKRHCNMKDAQQKEEDERIIDLATEVSQKLEQKLDAHAVTQEQLKDKIEITDRDNKTIISSLQELVKDFKSFKEQQERVNAKVEYIDQVFRTKIRLH